MTVFPSDPAFSPGDIGFKSVDPSGRSFDLLGRKGLGEQLSNLLAGTDQPLVVALDGSWGSGKSHFLKIWTGAHSK